jgi:tetraacyldisaccharide 4'-kinase
MNAWLERVWYGNGPGGAWLRPLALVFGAVVALRRYLYRSGRLRALPCGRPVVVVGNLTVGGSGKTPLIAWLAGRLEARGIRVGIVSRGYGGSSAGPLRVLPATDPALAGDEPVLLAQRTQVPVAIGRDRVAAARLIGPDVDLVLADDGLQHYRLARDLEILVIDGTRRYGNGRLLPAGPLREPVARGARADFVIVNGGEAHAGEVAMQLAPTAVVELGSGRRLPLGDFAGKRVHAVAGIGNPARFFATLRAAGVEPIEHPFPDHAPLNPADVAFGDGLPVLMTEKDAVKCASFAPAGLYWLEVAAELGPDDATRLVDRLVALAHGA